MMRAASFCAVLLTVVEGALSVPQRPEDIIVTVECEKEAQKAQWGEIMKARRVVADICGYEFFDCKRSEFRKGELDFLGGSFGQGVSAVFHNDPRMGVAAFKNCPANYKDSPFDAVADCKEEHLVKEPQLNVFIKVILARSVDRTDRYGADPRIRASLKESRRTRGMARLGFGMAMYDFFDIETKGPPPLMEDAIVTELVDGCDIHTFGSKNILLSYTAVARRHAKDLVSLYNQIQEHPRDSNLKQRFLSVCILAIRESWSRARWILSLVDTATYYMDRFHRNMLRHCDSHVSNIRFREHRVHTIEEFEEGIRLGHFAPIDPGDISFTLPFSEDAARKYSSPSEIPLVRFHPDEVRLIDMAYALDLSGVLRKRNYDLSSIETPCRLYRPIRDDDVASIMGWYEWAFYSGRGLERIRPEWILDNALTVSAEVKAGMMDEKTIVGRAFMNYVKAMDELVAMQSGFREAALDASPHGKACEWMSKTFWTAEKSGLPVKEIRQPDNELYEGARCTMEHERIAIQEVRAWHTSSAEFFQRYLAEGSQVVTWGLDTRRPPRGFARKKIAVPRKRAAYFSRVASEAKRQSLLQEAARRGKRKKRRERYRTPIASV